MREPITEELLRMVGFKWHQIERQPHKHWILWLGAAIRQVGVSYEDLGIEVAPSVFDTEWNCWIRSDVAHLYSRFLHVRHMKFFDEVEDLITGLVGRTFDRMLIRYGTLYSPDQLAKLKAEDERLDRRMLSDRAKWSEAEKDPTRAGALPEDLR